MIERRYNNGEPATKPMSSSLLTGQDYHNMALVRYLLRKLLRFSKDFVRAKAKLTPEQYEALLALKAFSNDEGLTVGQLSERVQVKHHTAVSLTDKLAARKLVTKRRGSPDRRYVYVKLTPAGTRLMASLAAAHRREIRTHAGQMIDALRKLKK
jgi:DNA-binding MarR family transcriptional regulator